MLLLDTIFTSFTLYNKLYNYLLRTVLYANLILESKVFSLRNAQYEILDTNIEGYL